MGRCQHCGGRLCWSPHWLKALCPAVQCPARSRFNEHADYLLSRLHIRRAS